MNSCLTRALCGWLAPGFLAAAALVGPAAAQPLSDKQLRIVVPFPAGGTADILPRIVGEKLRPRLPEGVIVENRAGAGGNIGAVAVYGAEPDGSTLLMSPPGPIAINHNLYENMSFDPTKWVPVTVLATVPNVLAVNADLPVKTVQEFIAYVKANPGKVTFASQGNGSTSHLTANMFMSLTGGKMIHIPYKGTSPALVGLMGGQVDVFFDNISSSLPHHKAGKLRILAVADDERSPALPSVPTFAESGLPKMNAVTWFGVVAPPGTPASIASSYQQAIAGALADPEVKRKFAQQGAQARGWSTQQTGEFIRAEADKWKQVIEAGNVKVQ